MSSRKDELLGESHSKASHRLRKLLLFKYVKLAGQTVCFRCGREIEFAEFSIDHIKSWQSAENPNQAFFDLDGIAFSHLRCNSSAAKSVRKKYFTREALRKARTAQAIASKKRHYSPEKRHRAYVDGKW